MLVGVSPSPAAGIDDIAPGASAEQSTAHTKSDQGDAAGADLVLSDDAPRFERKFPPTPIHRPVGYPT